MDKEKKRYVISWAIAGVFGALTLLVLVVDVESPLMFVFDLLCLFFLIYGISPYKKCKKREQAEKEAKYEAKVAEDKRIREEKLKEIESFWPYGENTVLAIRNIKSAEKDSCWKIERVHMSCSKGFELVVGEDAYKVVVKPSGLIAQKGDELYRFSSSELNLDEKWMICEGNPKFEVFKTVANWINLIGGTVFVKGDKNRNITDPDLLDLVKKYHFKYDGTYLSSEDINVAREYVNGIMESDPVNFPRSLFEYYYLRGATHYDLRALIGGSSSLTDIGASIAERRQSEVTLAIHQEEADIAQFDLDHNYKGSVNLPTDPGERAVKWTGFEVPFKYFKRLINNNKVCLVPSMLTQSGNYMTVSYESPFDLKALSDAKIRDEFNAGIVISRHTDWLKSFLNVYAMKNCAVTMTWNTSTSRFDSINILGTSYYVLRDAKEES